MDGEDLTSYDNTKKALHQKGKDRKAAEKREQ
jgi:hypothetical protein